jgi:hypothetical protein
MTPAMSAVLWLAWNGAAEVLRKVESDRSLLVRYEDLIELPVPTLNDILNRTGIDAPLDEVLDDSGFLAGENHALSGNPSRFQRGRVQLELDDRWERELRWVDRQFVLGLTWPMMLRYGYWP